MIQIKILNHAETAKSQGGLRGHIGVGLSKIGLMDLRARVEAQIAKQIREELQLKGVQAEVLVVESGAGEASMG